MLDLGPYLGKQVSVADWNPGFVSSGKIKDKQVAAPRTCLARTANLPIDQAIQQFFTEAKQALSYGCGFLTPG